MKNRTLLPITAWLIVFGSITALAVDPPGQLVAVFQNEPLGAPRDIMPRVLESSRDLKFAAPKNVELTVLNARGEKESITTGVDRLPMIRGITKGWYTVVAQSIRDIAVFPIFVDVVPDEQRGQITAADSEVNIPLMEEGRIVARAASRFYLTVKDEEDTEVDEDSFQYDSSDRHDYQVRLTSDGRLLGRVIARADDGQGLRLVANNNVLLVKDGRRLESKLSDENGDFEFEGVDEGVYGIVAAGPGGYTAFAFEATDTRIAVDRLQKHGFVARHVQQQQDGDVLPVILVSSRSLFETLETLEEGDCPPETTSNDEPQTANSPAQTVSPANASPGVPTSTPQGPNGTGGAPSGRTPGPGLIPAGIVGGIIAAADDDVASPSVP